MLTHDNHMNDDLLVSYLLKEADAAARQRVEDWIMESDANRRYYEHFRLLWETSKQIEAPLVVDEQQAWQRFRQRIHAAGGSAGKTVVKQGGKYATLFRVAASVVLVSTLLALFYVVWERNGPSPLTLASVDMPVNNTLPDGSEVTLNKHSSITFPAAFKGEARKIKMEGEAFFKVTPDKIKPFIVEVDGVTVTVLGTSFNIREAGDSTEVIVESGTVKVESSGGAVVLHAGEKVVVRPHDSSLVKEEEAGKLYNFYRTREFVCDDTPLWKLVEALNEAYDAQVTIGNPDLRSLPLTTTFKDEPLDNILSVISETFNITIVREKETIILK